MFYCVPRCRGKGPGISRSMTVGLFVFLVAASARFSDAQVPSVADAGLPANVEKYALAQEWNEVLQGLGSQEQLAAQPVARFLKGHACIALNRNDEAVALFASVTNKPDLDAWVAWTNRLAETAPDSPVASYLQADSLLRQDKRDPAIATYSKAIAKDPELRLARIGRGLAYTIKGDWRSADDDFDVACAGDKPLAEAFVGRGNLELWRCAPDGAMVSFQAALARIPTAPL